MLEMIVTALLGALFGFVERQIAESRAAAAMREAGRLEAERNQAIEGLRTQQENAAIAGRPLDRDGVLGRLGKGDA